MIFLFFLFFNFNGSEEIFCTKGYLLSLSFSLSLCIIAKTLRLIMMTHTKKKKKKSRDDDYWKKLNRGFDNKWKGKLNNSNIGKFWRVRKMKTFFNRVIWLILNKLSSSLCIGFSIVLFIDTHRMHQSYVNSVFITGHRRHQQSLLQNQCDCEKSFFFFYI